MAKLPRSARARRPVPAQARAKAPVTQPAAGGDAGVSSARATKLNAPKKTPASTKLHGQHLAIIATSAVVPVPIGW